MVHRFVWENLAESTCASILGPHPDQKSKTSRCPKTKSVYRGLTRGLSGDHNLDSVQPLRLCTLLLHGSASQAASPQCLGINKLTQLPISALLLRHCPLKAHEPFGLLPDRSEQRGSMIWFRFCLLQWTCIKLFGPVAIMKVSEEYI